ncbi:D-amino acid dehydrogenase [Methylophilus sp. VKM B-3414]|uniref:D-amino acid dehydrogenase n=1 Tax=Methylophilus sp. VKM B-3414 TaxID=3076121 RepID=UPI0028CA47E8|nr:D-amino acid dehydrogenase [Methylophilus sp. VKM B-3414]MDT7848522.1 D-amino acid dehydrogenase [Methylophilus sp. VKM B-3414]
MRVLVLGSGVIGVTSAYYLALKGFEVTVIDRQPAVALETSFANAGQISPGYSAPWASPDVPLKALKWLFQRHAPLSLKPDFTRWQCQWIAQFLSNCSFERYELNKSRMVRLAEYSRDCLRRLRAETGLHYEQRSQGTLQVFRTQKQLAAEAKDIAVLERMGVPFEHLDAAGCVRIEPALVHVQDALLGGLYLPGDETGDCQLFTTQLAAKAQALGVKFRQETQIHRLLTQQSQLLGVEVQTASGVEVLQADHYVVALGSYSRQLSQALGLNLPVYPVKGYSLTVPLINAAAAPVSTVMDETYKVAITRFDQRIRVGGMAELHGFDLSLNPSRRATLEFVFNGLFPYAGDVAQAQFWTGLRPMTPDGTPLIGQASAAYPNVWLNTGHGTLGWTMACGSGQVLADLMAQETPAIETQDLQLSRYL